MLTAFLLPTAIEFVHFSDGHEHIVCNDSSEHLHQAAADCSVFHAQLNSFQYQVTSYSQLVLPAVSLASVSMHTPMAVVPVVHTNTQLRAPPAIS